jgi:O-acetyl-ADP-ribose deacetylase (regulator of RNase III)
MKIEPILKIGNCEITILEGLPDGDLIRSGADVIVNSAGTSGKMRKSGDQESIASTILTKGGESIRKELQDHMPLIPGDVVITGVGRIPKPPKNIYHAVVVEWGSRQRVTQATIWRVVSRCMKLAQLTSMTSIAFPSLGTYSGGAERFETYSTMAAACLDSLRSGSSLRNIRFCFPYSKESAAIFRSAFGQQQFIWQTRGLKFDAPAEQLQFAEILEKIGSKILGEGVSVEILEDLNKKVDKLLQDPTPKNTINIFGDIYKTVTASGDRAVAIGGDASKGTIITGDQQKLDTGGGAYIGGGVNTGGGDFVGRDQTISGDKVSGDKVGGDKIQVGDISGSTGVAIGRDAEVTVSSGLSGEELQQLFAPLMRTVQESPQNVREQAVEKAEELESEVAKSEEADDTRMANLIDGLVELVPGAVSAVTAIFVNPVLAGLTGPVTKFVLDKIQRK